MKYNNIILEGKVFGLDTLNNKKIDNKIISLRNLIFLNQILLMGK